MKLVVYDWAQAVGSQRLEPHKHNELFEGTESGMFGIVKWYLSKKLNVMILNRDDGYTIAVDTKSFGQR